MGKPLAIAADFSDLRTVKTRKIVQLILEIPAERAKEALDMLGFPQSDKPIPVALALLKTGPVKADGRGLQAPALPQQGQAAGPKSEGERALIRCAILCNEPRFKEWVARQPLSMTHASAADYVRARCGITTRSQIAADPAVMRRWLQLETKYLQDTDQMAEQRG